MSGLDPWAFSWDALAAVGQVAGALATGVAAVVAVVVYRQSQRDARAAQASLVTAWLERVAGAETFMAVVQNGSRQPVFDVVAGGVRVGLTTAQPWVLAQPVLPAGEPLKVGTPIPVIFPNEKYLPLALTFSDASGRRWERDGGSLRRVSRGKLSGRRRSPSVPRAPGTEG